ncbi:MAG: ATP-binding protein [Candidatus Binatus sp.]|uniref:AlbA family DNA-binding domain-containing protein n=1 Tax=Candidatus Binatus sp. TaxID=2811406 RepID=UPI003C71F764
MSKSYRSLLGRVALIVVLLFTAVAAGQYCFLSYQLRKETRDALWDWAEGLRESISFTDTWHLEGYRRTTEGPDIYLVMSESGTLIDTHGYLPSMILSQVSLPFRFNFDRPIRVSSDLNETWNLYVHKLNDGIVILGVRDEITPAHVEDQFAAAAASFGNSVADAMRVPERAINEGFDYAVVDADGILRWAIGGIPLKAAAPSIPIKPTLGSVRELAGKLYIGLTDPIAIQSGRKIGLIKVFDEVTDERRILRQSAAFNFVVAVALTVIFVTLAAIYLKRTKSAGVSCVQLPGLEESETLEFKSSLRWDVQKDLASQEVERQVVKGVAGFFNSWEGGTLVIGITDHKEVVGLEHDYRTLGDLKHDRDGFELALGGILGKAIGQAHRAQYVEVRFCSLRGKEVCLVDVAPGDEAVYVPDEQGRPTLYVRMGNATKPLKEPREIVTYAARRWPAPTWHVPIRLRSAAQSEA